jgi:hypothetical protein
MSIPAESAEGERGFATLINLNPNINVWYLLQLTLPGAPVEYYHLENENPRTQTLLLDRSVPGGLVVDEGGQKYDCDLCCWDTAGSALRAARQSGVAYAPLCDGRVYLRNQTKGHRTAIEIVTDLLRDNAPGGERIVDFVRDTLYKDAFVEHGEIVGGATPAAGVGPEKSEDAPEPALLDPKHTDNILKPPGLGIEIEGASPEGLALGTWYPARGNPGIFVSVMVAHAIAPEILRSYPGRVNPLDNVESSVLVFLVAFDLDRFDVNYALGTEHPRVDWSAHILPQVRDPSLPGPDGIGDIAPLVSTGLISPRDAGKTVATFTAGFKRSHGAFRWGPLALKNSGSHYGFLENGVVFSKLQPDLATLYVLEDGSADMKTWTEQDNFLLPSIRYARQNGVPIIEGFESASRSSIPGPLVSQWGPGNWSGSEDKKLRSLRSGAALQELASGKRYLIYAVFTTGTPSSMARVFQAYRCRYAMLLDMNALEHTYAAIYRRQGSRLYVQHLIEGMSQLDKVVGNKYIPRFLGYPDNRDFFYLTRKEAP